MVNSPAFYENSGRGTSRPMNLALILSFAATISWLAALALWLRGGAGRATPVSSAGWTISGLTRRREPERISSVVTIVKLRTSLPVGERRSPTARARWRMAASPSRSLAIRRSCRPAQGTGAAGTPRGTLVGLDGLGHRVDRRVADLDVPIRDQPPPHQVEAASPLLGIVAHHRQGISRCPFQVGAKFGSGRSGGIEKAILISLTSEERRTRPHIGHHYR
jgi:hypothetical protein